MIAAVACAVATASAGPGSSGARRASGVQSDASRKSSPRPRSRSRCQTSSSSTCPAQNWADELSAGDHTIVCEFEVTGDPDTRSGKGAPGTGTLLVDGNKVGSVDMNVTVPILFSIEGISIGHDYGDSVDRANYKPTFPFDLSGDAIKDAAGHGRHSMSKQ